ncbi:MAG: MoaD/ThiS family protein [Candidatus Helarchaeota archaeon]
MPKVKCIFFSALYDITQVKKLELDTKGTISDALNVLFQKYGTPLKKRIVDEKTGKIKRYIIIAVNRKDIRHIAGLDTPLNEGDEISILPAAAGG